MTAFNDFDLEKKIRLSFIERISKEIIETTGIDDMPIELANVLAYWTLNWQLPEELTPYLNDLITAFDNIVYYGTQSLFGQTVYGRTAQFWWHGKIFKSAPVQDDIDNSS